MHRSPLGRKAEERCVEDHDKMKELALAWPGASPWKPQNLPWPPAQEPSKGGTIAGEKQRLPVR